MVSKKSRSEVRRKKHMKLRNRFSGTAQRPRLAVFRSNNHMYAQIIDDTIGNTLVSASTLQKDVKEKLEKKPETVIELAVKGMLPKGPLGRSMYTKLFVYAGPEHKHEAQKPEALTF